MSDFQNPGIRKYPDLTDERLQKIMTLEEAIYVTVQLQETLKKFMRYVELRNEEYNTILDIASSAGAQLLDGLDVYATHTPEQFLQEAAQNINYIYRLVMMSDFCRRFISSDDRAEIRHDVFDIEGKYVNGKFIIRLPLLATQWAVKAPHTGATGYRYSHIFSCEVEDEMKELVKYVEEDELLKFRKKTITYLFNYHSDTKHISDADNKDTKAITDAITEHLHGGDTALTCNFFYADVLHDEYPIGAYVVVSQGVFNPQFSSCLDEFYAS